VFLFCYFHIVVILSVRGVLVRKFMIAAHSLGMTKGDWTFLDVEIFQVSLFGFFFFFRQKLGQSITQAHMLRLAGSIDVSVI
jgi:hypothetical protein